MEINAAFWRKFCVLRAGNGKKAKLPVGRKISRKASTAEKAFGRSGLRYFRDYRKSTLRSVLFFFIIEADSRSGAPNQGAHGCGGADENLYQNADGEKNTDGWYDNRKNGQE